MNKNIRYIKRLKEEIDLIVGELNITDDKLYKESLESHLSDLKSKMLILVIAENCYLTNK